MYLGINQPVNTRMSVSNPKLLPRQRPQRRTNGTFGENETLIGKQLTDGEHKFIENDI